MKRIRKGGYIALFGLGASAVVGLDTNQTMVFQLFTFLLLLVSVSLGSTFFFRGRFRARRVLPKFATAGEEVSYRVYIENRSRKKQVGLYVFEDYERECPSYDEFVNLAEPGEAGRNLFDRYMGVYRWRWLLSGKQGAPEDAEPLPPLNRGEEREVRISFTPKTRGIFRLRGMSVALPDPFGLFFGFTEILEPDTLLVLPRRYPVPLMRFQGSRKYQSGGVALAGSVGESEEFVSLRDYRPGDPLRRIHWRSWAKRGEPVVKEFQEEFFVRYALVLDTFQGQRRDFRDLEGAVSVAASFAATLVTGESLLDLMFAGDAAYCFTAGRSLGRVSRILELLASVTPSAAKFSVLSELVLLQAERMSGCICVLLSWDDDRKKMVSGLKNRGISLRVIVVTGEESIMDPGPMADEPHNFHVIDPGCPGEGLAGLR